MKNTRIFTGLILVMTFCLTCLTLYLSCNGEKARYAEPVGGRTTEPAFDYWEYEFTDIVGNTFVLRVNTDDTCQLRQKGQDFVYYGSESVYSDETYLKFSELPIIIFPSTKKGCYLTTSNDWEYIYADRDDCDAKNPNERLKLKRVK